MHNSAMLFYIKAILGAVVVKGVLFLGLSWNIPVMLKELNAQDFNKNANTITSLLVTMTETAVALNNVVWLQRVLMERSKNHDILYVRILYSHKVLVEIGNLKTLKRQPRIDKHLADVDDGVFDTVVEIKRSNKVVGRIELGFSIGEPEQTLTIAQLWLCAIAFIELVLFAVFLVVIRKRTVQRLYCLKEASKRISAGELGYQIDDVAKDEGAGVVNSFNKMSVALKEAHAQLELQNTKLKRLDRFKDDFLANVTHEFETPINEIVASSEVLGDALVSGEVLLAQKPFAQVLEAAMHLLNLVNKTLKFSHERYEKAHHDWENININDYFSVLVKRFKFQANANGVELACDIAQPVSFYSDHHLLDQVFVNLVANAIKFTHNGRASINGSKVGNNVLAITVADTGEGVSQELHEQIFARFYTGIANNEQSLAGNGLGLAIVKEALLLLDGAIDVVSVLGQGSEFTVLLPLSKDVSRLDLRALWHHAKNNDSNPSASGDVRAVAKLHQPARIVVPPVGFKRNDIGGDHAETRWLKDHQTTILVVDDDIINREVVRANLYHKFNTIEADNGALCLQLLSQHSIDIVLLDLMMPGMSGFDVLEHLRKTNHNHKIPVIVLSAREQAADIVRAFELGAVDYVTKPFQREVLIARIQIQVELKQMNQALRWEKEYIHNIFDSSIDMMIAVDQQRNIVSFNRTAEQTFGYMLSEICGKSIEILYADQNAARLVFDTVKNDGKYIGEVTNRRKDNTSFVAILSASTLLDKDDNVIGSVVSSRDITEQKHIEIIQKEKEKAEIASKFKSEFLANMSHEIRTPLNGILGMAELLGDSGLDDSQKLYMKSIQSEAKALSNLINSILDFLKIEAGKMVLECIPFDLHYLLNDFADGFAIRMEQKGIRFISFFSPKICSQVVGDPGRLRQVLVNLVGNALKFTPAGGEVLVFCELIDDQGDQFVIRFSVTDTGIGIPRDKQEIIFESFTQTDGSTTRKYGGTGLGTTISKQLTEIMGGEIGLVSDEGKGSEFWFTVLLQKQQDIITQVVAEDIDLTGLRVLVVDAIDSARFVIVEYLKSWGCIPVEVVSGSHAVDVLLQAVADKAHVDLVITDIDINDGSGFDLVKQLRSTAALTGLPIIVLTSLDNRAESKRYSDLNIAGYLSKPIKDTDMRNVINMAMGFFINQTEQAEVVLDPQHLAAEQQKSICILVVEDYPTNQKVVVAYLQRAGYPVELAENGQKAVAAVKRKHFDLILMDVQMPVMDGYQATQMIRSFERQAGMEKTPIVAMTAHALQGDRKKCLDAGMDDYLTKPLNRAELLKMVAKMVASSAPEEEVSGPLIVMDSADYSNIPIDFDKAVSEFEGERDLVIEILDEFLQNVNVQVATIANAITAQDSEVIRREAHAIKGGAANITAHPLAAAALALEETGKQDNLEKSAVALKTLMKEIVCLQEFYDKLDIKPQTIARAGGSTMR